MTFGGEVKNELCRQEVHRKCCAQAEAYGVLLYCNTFSGTEIRIVTEHDAFAQRLPALFKKAFHIAFYNGMEDDEYCGACVDLFIPDEKGESLQDEIADRG